MPCHVSPIPAGRRHHGLRRLAEAILRHRCRPSHPARASDRTVPPGRATHSSTVRTKRGEPYSPRVRLSAPGTLRRARQSYADGDFRWVAQVVNHVVFADPHNAGSRALQADTLEQLATAVRTAPGATSTSWVLSNCATVRVGTPTVAALPVMLAALALGPGGRAASKGLAAGRGTDRRRSACHPAVPGSRRAPYGGRNMTDDTRQPRLPHARAAPRPVRWPLRWPTLGRGDYGKAPVAKRSLAAEGEAFCRTTQLLVGGFRPENANIQAHRVRPPSRRTGPDGIEADQRLSMLPCGRSAVVIAGLVWLGTSAVQPLTLSRSWYVTNPPEPP
jgi:hypothetical protein